jgi:hypothetical protein
MTQITDLIIIFWWLIQTDKDACDTNMGHKGQRRRKEEDLLTADGTIPADQERSRALQKFATETNTSVFIWGWACRRTNSK